MIPELDWYQYAACKNTSEPDWWFPPTGVSAAPAKAVCAGCEARTECLDYALSIPGLQGIWGMTTPEERKRIRGSRARARRQHA